MSWPLGSLVLLAFALAAGFAWYERQRPDARVVALVGTLAAFAALGRIAFAALPNVKPTTDIVLISGYALGGGPGFAVGALAGLTSNFFFGQGPWTPWQMAAWGATGVLGAGVARLGGLRTPQRHGHGHAHGQGRGPGHKRGHGHGHGHGAGRHPAAGRGRIGRWPLAVVCCVAGFAFTVIQDIGDWVTYSDHSLAQLEVYVGQGLGFDAVHAAGCLGFALAFGPALTRSIQRFARRLQVTWVSSSSAAGPSIAAALVLCAAVSAGAPAKAAAAANRVGASTSYLLAAENPDGGFGAAAGQPSTELYTGWAALGLASAGYDLQRVARGQASVLAYVRAGARSLSGVGSLERTILVVQAAGLSARSFAGHDLVAALAGHIRADGSVSEQVNLTSFALLALRAAGVAPAARTIAWLERQQGGDGGFGFAGAGAGSDVDDTGAVLEALAGEGGRAGRVRDRAIRYLRRQQDRDGGFPSQPGGESNAQSTAWAIQGLDAAHVDPARLHRGGSASPLAFLNSMITAAGAVRYQPGVVQTPVWVTGEALMALEGKPLPLADPVNPTAPLAPAPGRPARPRGAGRSHRAGGVRGVAGIRGAAGVRPTQSRPRRGAAPSPLTRASAAAGRGAPASMSAMIVAVAGGAGSVVALLLATLGLG